MSFISYAQNFEDVMLWRALKSFPPGLYIDLGAQDPVVDSVSKAFYDAGWRGTHVEPSPFYAAALREAYAEDEVIEAAVTNKAGKISFYELAGGGLSTARLDIADFHHDHSGHNLIEREVSAITLADILSNLPDKPIHWLKIDVEGLEREVLEGWAPSLKRPWIVVIESTFPTTAIELHHEWESLITAKGYDLAYTDGLNRFYLHESRVDLRDCFRYPPNVFDDFELSGTATSMTVGLVRRYEADLEERSSRIDALDVSAKDAWRECERLNALIKYQKVQFQLDQTKAGFEIQRLRLVEQNADEEARSALKAWALADSRQEKIDELNDELATVGTLLDEQRELTIDWRAKHEMQFQSAVDSNYSRRRAEEWAEIAREEVTRLSREIDDQAQKIDQLREVLSNTLRENTELSATLSRVAGTFWVRILMAVRLLRAEVHSGAATSDSTSRIAREILPIPELCKLPASCEDNYPMAEIIPTHVNQLLAANGEVFVDLVYRTVLRRSPDKAGREHYITRLRDGESKEAVIIAVSKSPEARALAINLEGLEELHARNAFRLRRSNSVQRLERSINRMEFTFGEFHSRTEARVNKILDRLETIEATLASPFPQGNVGTTKSNAAHVRRPVRDTVNEITSSDPTDFVHELRKAVRLSSEAAAFPNPTR